MLTENIKGGGGEYVCVCVYIYIYIYIYGLDMGNISNFLNHCLQELLETNSYHNSQYLFLNEEYLMQTSCIAPE
jgi:hypothetical protein